MNKIGLALLYLICLIAACSRGSSKLVGTWEGTTPKKSTSTWTFKADGTYEQKTTTADYKFLTTGQYKETGGKLEATVDTFSSTPTHPAEGMVHQMKGQFVELPFKWSGDDTFISDEGGEVWTYGRTSGP